MLEKKTKNKNYSKSREAIEVYAARMQRRRRERRKLERALPTALNYGVAVQPRPRINDCPCYVKHPALSLPLAGYTYILTHTYSIRKTIAARFAAGQPEEESREWIREPHSRRWRDV